jgi:hypothetical protein
MCPPASDHDYITKEELNAEYPLTQAQLVYYKENGFIRLKQVFSKELLSHYQEAIESEVDRADKTPLEEDESYASAFVQVRSSILCEEAGEGKVGMG